MNNLKDNKIPDGVIIYIFYKNNNIKSGKYVTRIYVNNFYKVANYFQVQPYSFFYFILVC